jgi:adenine/guanine phosphoribosyltransferase-like PRPP-binding protein
MKLKKKTQKSEDIIKTYFCKQNTFKLIRNPILLNKIILKILKAF